MICVISGFIKTRNTELNTNDCYFGRNKVIVPINEDPAEVLILSWIKDIENTCPDKAKRPKTLYDILKMKEDNDYHMIHAADKYLSSKQGKVNNLKLSKNFFHMNQIVFLEMKVRAKIFGSKDPDKIVIPF